jgi:hypothetical protein
MGNACGDLSKCRKLFNLHAALFKFVNAKGSSFNLRFQFFGM